MPIRLFFFVRLSSMTWSQTRKACTLGFAKSVIGTIVFNGRLSTKEFSLFHTGGTRAAMLQMGDGKKNPRSRKSGFAAGATRAMTGVARRAAAQGRAGEGGEGSEPRTTIPPRLSTISPKSVVLEPRRQKLGVMSTIMPLCE